MCPDNDGLRWLVTTMARGQLRRGSSLLAQPGAAGQGYFLAPSCTAPFRKSRVPWDMPTPPASYPWWHSLVGFAGAMFAPKACPGGEKPRHAEACGKGGRTRGQHPHGWTRLILEEPVTLRSPPAAKGQHLGTGTVAWGGCHLQGGPGVFAEGPRVPAAPRHPSRLWEAFQASRWGRGTAAARRRAEKAIFSRYIFYKSNILCISALPGKASRAQPRDSPSEPVSQQWLAATGREVGSPCAGVSP